MDKSQLVYADDLEVIVVDSADVIDVDTSIEVDSDKMDLRVPMPTDSGATALYIDEFDDDVNEVDYEELTLL